MSKLTWEGRVSVRINGKEVHSIGIWTDEDGNVLKGTVGSSLTDGDYVLDLQREGE